MFAQRPQKPSEQPAANPRRGIFAGMRIRKKLFVLHTLFSISLGVILLIALKPAMSKVINSAEQEQAHQLAVVLFADSVTPDPLVLQRVGEQSRIVIGTQSELGLSGIVADLARGAEANTLPIGSDGTSAGVARWLGGNQYAVVRVRAQRAREMIRLVYALVVVTLLVGYMLVAAALEMFVLPGHLYGPIRAMLKADLAVQDGDRENEIIPSPEIPGDELGEIMRSRNNTIETLRTNERKLAHTLDKLEHAAADLHKKNMLLETAQRNLEGADRLASLGMMSAGIAHELNTPLAVVKGLVDKLSSGDPLSTTEITLLSRVVGRLEKLSDGLLDFARVRPPKLVGADIHKVVDDAWMLVRLDRQIAQPGQNIEVLNEVPKGTVIQCDPDRLFQVFVNLIRNAISALVHEQGVVGRVRISASRETRDDIAWVKILVEDNGPGIYAEMIGRLFEPFASTKLDAKGTGLGLAVANGIIREHHGVLTVTNKPADAPETGAVFELLLREAQRI
ncbi:MAG: hypothetical protein JKY96_08380 [Phycisphaerales bacterium]|nr:hypothetical protein [Phycisphaerales bacterium]